jgi:hypothetical protein
MFEAETFMNIGPLIRTREELYASSPIGSPLGASEEKRARLLELRTDSGLLYIRPSGWQRIRLLWTFRHFPVLPPQLLSRGDQRLIERLSRSALVTPSLPVPKSTIFGVVENVRTNEDQAVVLLEEPELSPTPDSRFPQWSGALAAVIAVCLILVLARVYGSSLLTHLSKSPAAPGLTVQAAVQAAVQSPVAAPPPTLPAAEKAEPRALPPAPRARQARRPVIDSSPAPAPAELPVITPYVASQRPFVAALPQGHLVQPVLSDPNLAGEVVLRALIGADGSVTDVTFVSGNAKLAQAGMNAVRRWHYAQNDERETLIRMNFFGQDAVSITSVTR